MALIMNATNENVHILVHGNHFEFKPKQIKMFQEHVSRFIETERQDKGLVSLPAEFEEPEFKASEEGKKILAEKEEQGINNFCKALRQVIYNNQVSLRRDLEMANIKASPETYASDGEMKAMELLVKYQRRDEDLAQVRKNKMDELKKQLEKSE